MPGLPAKLAVLGFVLLLPCGLPAQEGRLTAGQVDLNGRVRTDQGGTVKSARVRLETLDSEAVADQPVTTAGEFYFPAVAKRIYYLIVTAEGFETYREQLDLGAGPNVFSVTVTLIPANKMPERSAPPPALSDAQAPKEAKREYEKGVKALQSRKLGDARKHLEAAVSVYPCYARAQTDLGVLLSQEKDYKGSEAALRKSVTCDPGYVDAYSELGALLNAERRYDEAVAVLDQGVRQAPGSWQFYYQMGAAQYGLKHYDLAEQQYTKAQSLAPNPPPELEAKLADVYLRENSFQKAYAAMQGYLKTQPDGRLAPRIKEIMKQMESSGVLQAQQTKPSPVPQQP
jgi:tetratricopeptide (TPR) repeat protein